jgi:hypothetical protein
LEDKYELHVIAKDSQTRERVLYALTQLCEELKVSGIYFVDNYGDIKFHMGADGGVIGQTEN